MGFSDDWNEMKNILPVIIPLLIFEIFLIGYYFKNIIKRKDMTPVKKLLWIAIILLTNILGCITYVAFKMEK